MDIKLNETFVDSKHGKLKCVEANRFICNGCIFYDVKNLDAQI